MKLLRRLFIVYCIVLFIFLLTKFDLSVDSMMNKINSVRLSRAQGTWNINLIPFKTILSQLHRLKSIPVIIINNIIGNIVIFIPFGFFLPMGFETMRKCFKTLLIGIVFILAVEVTQFVCMLGSFDVDDILLNGIGVLGGYIVFKLFMNKKHTKEMTTK